MDVKDGKAADPAGWFAGQLRRLMTAAGAASDRDLAQFAGKHSQLPHSTVSHWTSGKQPGLPTPAFVSRFVQECFRLALSNGIMLTPQDADLRRWLTLRAECDAALRQVRKAVLLELAGQWAQRFDVAGWTTWTQKALFPPQGFPFAVQDSLVDAVQWLVGVEWPTDFPRCAMAMQNFRSAVGDLLDFFTSSSVSSERIDSFYEIRDISPGLWRDREAQLRAEQDYVAKLMLFTELVFEVTAAANHALKAVRSEVDRSFAGESTMAVVVYGPTMEGRFETFAWDYEPERSRLDHPYPGLAVLAEQVSAGSGGQ